MHANWQLLLWDFGVPLSTDDLLLFCMEAGSIGLTVMPNLPLPLQGFAGPFSTDYRIYIVSEMEALTWL